MSRRVLYLDCAGGAAGDMVLCALTEAAGCPTIIEELPGKLGFSDLTVDWPAGRSGGFAARRLRVGFDPQAHPDHRNLADVEAIIDDVELSEFGGFHGQDSIQDLGRSRGRGSRRDRRGGSFPRGGAVDAIVDIIGACLALDQLAVDEVVCSSLPMGSGTVDCAHGTMPLPAPAVAAMLPGSPSTRPGSRARP